MAIWKDSSPRREPETTPQPEAAPTSPAPAAEARRAPARSAAESVIAAGITIEGKIEGSGHVRVAGSFTGDIHVQGDLTIEAGAKVTGGVRAATVTIAGELHGNIEAADRVDLRETGVLAGDLQSGSLIVAAGSRMRGQVEFGWSDKASPRAQPPQGNFQVA